QHKNILCEVQAIGLSGQQHAATLLDTHNKVLRPAILWNDGRSHEECLELERRLPTIRSITCNKMMPGYTAPKLLWLKKHEPELFKSIAKVLLPKDYLRLKMTGNYASDMSDASGTMWLDVQKRKWSDDALSACDLNLEHMPQVYEGNDITGTLLPEVASAWGMSPQTVVVGGAGDNAAGALGSNVTEAGSACLSLGTSGTYFVAINECVADLNGSVPCYAHCLPHRWHLLNCHLSAASCLHWLSQLLSTDINQLLAAAEANFTSSGRTPLFLPYLTGERTPINDPYALGTFIGLTPQTKKADLMQAVLEGVAFNFTQGQELLQAINVEVNTVAVVGGGTKNFYWGKILATCLQRRLHYCFGREVGAALGAARLAWLGVNGGDPALVFPSPVIEKTVEPEYSLTAHYEKKMNLFKKSYLQLKPIFEEHFYV
ncbi:MAG: xylulokinase, partial [Legionellales bacterium]